MEEIKAGDKIVTIYNQIGIVKRVLSDGILIAFEDGEQYVLSKKKVIKKYEREHYQNLVRHIQG